ncbi:glutamate decarboxylase [Antrihabitans cavernicola]|uniref:Glutamate decarboxylase n=1 Tax=Antrihabitans cavernicola TaxID=2495913 RepID=A0A5A7S3F0_9NOCA|nr:glutamate decarboxylase [Spelaeibacter cavernicola]KAA0016182.1 glutamate decarboxylase [Spelaeibacter cavernicola]
MGLVQKAGIEEITRRATRTSLTASVLPDDIADAVNRGLAAAASGNVSETVTSSQEVISSGIAKASEIGGALSGRLFGMVRPKPHEKPAPPPEPTPAPIPEAAKPTPPPATHPAPAGATAADPEPNGFPSESYQRAPTFFLQAKGCGVEHAYEMISSELLLDGSARLNLATFVTTSMPPLAARLMAETADKNMIDKDEYPQTAEMEARCVNIISNLWNSPSGEYAMGCSTTGSSEAVMLGGLAMKWRWREKMRALGKPTDKPNLVTGANVQVCWDKFMRYWDVEERLVPLEGNKLHLTADRLWDFCDENTIGVAAVLGSTFDGSYEPITEIAAALDEIQEKKGWDIPLHIDAASGGFVAPFIQPDLVWDFRIPRVVSINASGHKYGLVYPGVGWAIWRSPEFLPKDLIFEVNYLGGQMPTFSLNFSRPGSEVVAQYFMFTSLGFEGYRRVQQQSSDIAQYLSAEIEKIGPYELVSRGDELPVFAFKLKNSVKNYTVFDVSDRLRERGWQVPAYTYPANRTDLAVLRVVVRAGMTHDMADLLLADLRKHTARLESLSGPMPESLESGDQIFAH